MLNGLQQLALALVCKKALALSRGRVPLPGHGGGYRSDSIPTGDHDVVALELVRTAQSGAAKAVKIHLRRALHRRRRRQKGAPGNASARTFAPPSFACPCVLT